MKQDDRVLKTMGCRSILTQLIFEDKMTMEEKTALRFAVHCIDRLKRLENESR